MRKALIDTGFLYALLNDKDSKHEQVVEAAISVRGMALVLPAPVIVETSHLLLKRVDHSKVRKFLKYLISAPFEFEQVQKSDMNRIYDLIESYRDLELDFVDAAIMTLAERLEIQQILTVDQKDFRAVKPKHCGYFEILP